VRPHRLGTGDLLPISFLAGSSSGLIRWCVAVVQNAGSHSEIATADLLAQAWPLMVSLLDSVRAFAQ
jgi:hypothetical protein